MAKKGKKRRREQALYIYELKADGQTDDEIMEEMDLDQSEFDQLVGEMFSLKKEDVQSKQPADIFVQYQLDMDRNISDLDVLIANLDRKKQYNAVIGAIRLRADIQDRVLKTGQELGIINRAPKQVAMFGGLVMAELSSDDLKKYIATELSGLKVLQEQFGEKDIMQLPAGDTHYGPAVDVSGVTVEEKPKKAVGKAKAKSSKVSRGRRRVRTVET